MSCVTKFVTDIPSKQDLLGGSHSRIASAIADVVKDEEGGNAIALEGKWGSGKSSIIEMASSELSESRVPVFVFDASMNHRTSLQDSFFEKLLQFIREKNLVDEQTWTTELEQFSRTDAPSAANKKPSLTLHGRILSLLLLLVPLGAVLARFESNFVNLWIVGIAISCIPFLYFLLANIRESRKLKSKGVQGASFFQVKFIDGKSDRGADGMVSTSPASRIFESEEAFSHLMNVAMFHTKKMVIAIENIDRINATEALNFWSMLTTFHLNESDKNSKVGAWRKKIWMVVSYDPNGIKKLWDSLSNNDLVISDSNFISYYHDKTNIAEAFLSKSFLFRFAVPLPTIVKWKEFLKKCLANVLSAPQGTGIRRSFPNFRSVSIFQ